MSLDTATLQAIRADIEPNTGWWQRPLRKWHYVVAISVASVIGASLLALLFVAVHAR